MGRSSNVPYVRPRPRRFEFRRAVAGVPRLFGHAELDREAALGGAGGPSLDRADVGRSVRGRRRGVRGSSEVPDLP